MLAPPSDAGAAQDRVTWPLPGLAVSPFGGPGLVIAAAGVADAAPEAEPSPALLTAVTLKK